MRLWQELYRSFSGNLACPGRAYYQIILAFQVDRAYYETYSVECIWQHSKRWFHSARFRVFSLIYAIVLCGCQWANLVDAVTDCLNSSWQTSKPYHMETKSVAKTIGRCFTMTIFLIEEGSVFSSTPREDSSEICNAEHLVRFRWFGVLDVYFPFVNVAVPKHRRPRFAVAPFGKWNTWNNINDK